MKGKTFKDLFNSTPLYNTISTGNLLISYSNQLRRTTETLYPICFSTTTSEYQDFENEGWYRILSGNNSLSGEMSIYNGWNLNGQTVSKYTFIASRPHDGHNRVFKLLYELGNGYNISKIRMSWDSDKVYIDAYFRYAKNPTMIIVYPHHKFNLYTISMTPVEENVDSFLGTSEFIFHKEDETQITNQDMKVIDNQPVMGGGNSN